MEIGLTSIYHSQLSQFTIPAENKWLYSYLPYLLADLPVSPTSSCGKYSTDELKNINKDVPTNALSLSLKSVFLMLLINLSPCNKKKNYMKLLSALLKPVVMELVHLW